MCGSQSPMDGTYQMANMLLTGFLRRRQVPEAVCGQIDDESIAQDDDKEVTYSYEPDSDTYD